MNYIIITVNYNNNYYIITFITAERHWPIFEAKLLMIQETKTFPCPQYKILYITNLVNELFTLTAESSFSYESEPQASKSLSAISEGTTWQMMWRGFVLTKWLKSLIMTVIMSLITYPSYFRNVISPHSLISFQSVCTLKVRYSLKKNTSNVNYSIDPQNCSLSLIINPLLAELVLFRWLDINIVLFCTKNELGQYPAILDLTLGQ